jgi:predicted DNA-binding protein (UPF0251 family)
MISINMVFYGNIPKSRAARAMKITYQSLKDHISGALKKIEKSLLRKELRSKTSLKAYSTRKKIRWENVGFS